MSALRPRSESNRKPPWLHVGGDVSYGWFDYQETSDDGWLTPHLHADIHLPLGRGWELIAGLEAGLPEGDETLTGRHWEWAPHLELRYDQPRGFLEAGASYAFISGDEHNHAEDGAAHAEDHALEIHQIVEPHGERAATPRWACAGGGNG